MATRWGIASAGKISHDFVTALSVLPLAEHVVVAVAARQLSRAKDFATLHNIKAAYGSYEELAKDPNVDVVYVGSIHPQHLQIASLMLSSGKPCLVEKPLTLNLKETKQLINLARNKKLFLMEAIWSRFFPVYQLLRDELKAGTLGDVLQVIANFGIPIEAVERIKQVFVYMNYSMIFNKYLGCMVILKELGGGSILDIGVYVLQLAVLVFGPVIPEKILASGDLNKEGVDSSVAAILNYGAGKVATLSTHTRVTFPNEAFIVGTKGTIKASGGEETSDVASGGEDGLAARPWEEREGKTNNMVSEGDKRRVSRLQEGRRRIHSPFWCPTTIETPTKKREFPVPPCSKPFNHVNSSAMSYEAQEVRRCLLKGLIESPGMTHAESLVLAELEDKLRAAVGTRYSQDD
uniref:Trans-1,2-dihydrobenzene-1,2-diol dehydrogenase n=1 Tax=Timema californicum TaxID=61474 RepID=A0A7R9JFU6_TIMCA|nr:unnamed protein product [Timema californicum]